MSVSFQENVEYILIELERSTRLKKDVFRANAYRKALNIIKGIKLETPSDAKDAIGIGKGIMQKLEEIYKTGRLDSCGIEGKKNNADADADADSDESTVDMVYGIGPEKTKCLGLLGIKTVNELKKAYEDKKDGINLTSNQIVGLKHFDDIERKIPRAEIDKYNKKLSDVLFGCVWQIAGSYRRGKSQSGDIDVIVKSDIGCNNNDIFEKIYSSGIIVEILAKGKKKLMGIAKLEDETIHRRIDILIIEDKYYYSSLLYFTGSQEHNIKMRKLALEKGYTLNEYGYTVKKSAHDKDKKSLQVKIDNYVFDSEKSLFDFIEIDYVEPRDR